MPTDLILPDGLAPSNLHLRSTVQQRFVEADLYNICERMREIDQNLFAVELSEGDRHKFAIMEHCADGVERLVFHVDELDGRVIDRLGQIMAMPLLERLKLLEAEEYRYEAERQENESEALYERMGHAMWWQLEHDGFIGPRPKSYPKRGIKPCR